MQEQIIANPKGPTSTANKAKLSPYWLASFPIERYKTVIG